MQKSLREAASADVSDKDSSDPLSELDKQETLLRNINTKNKHIKRLLREIEVSLFHCKKLSCDELLEYVSEKGF